MFTSINPATGLAGASFAELNRDEIDRALDQAQAAYQSWRLTDMDTRVALLRAIADQYDRHADRLARTMTLEMGKTLKSAQAEIAKCAAGLRHYAEHGPAMLADREIELANGGKALAKWLPQGPVLAIMPWNFPFWQVVRFMAPTILAGNVGLLKHASNVQGCAALLEEMVHAAGAPDGVFRNLPIKSDKVADIIADDRVVAVTLTGSEGAGIKVAEAAGRALKKVVLELGGSDPFVVMPSADLDAAVKAAVTARIQNTGQSCICAKRMIVHADIYEDFLDRFATAMRAVKAGDPMSEDIEMGPLSSAEQRDTVLEQVAAAQQQGGRLLFGAEPIGAGGAFMSAGVIVDLPADAPITREEIFGPVAMVFRAADIDDAVRLANDIPFGLGSSIWTNDDAERDRLVRDIEAGMVAVNQMLASSPEAPFGGVKRSGHGRELSAVGLHEFMNLKTVMLSPPPVSAKVE